jgi:cytochrome c peroxidase
MHDGSSTTLEEVVELYNRGGGDASNKSKLIYKLNLTEQEKADLVVFMKSLNGTLPQMKAPAMYPEADAHSKGEPGRQ